MRIIFFFILVLSSLMFSQNATEQSNSQAKTNTSSDFILVEGGTFMMGNNDAESCEKPAHKVKLNDFSICKHEVTQGEWQAIMGEIPGISRGDNYPVNQVFFESALIYCNRLSIKEGRTPCYTVEGKPLINDSGVFDDLPVCDFKSNGYRLPTEAEWEYAARGGNKSKGFVYSGSNNIDEVAWYEDNSDAKVHPVCTKAPNELGIYDMSGNVDEYCWDKFDCDAYENSPAENPVFREESQEIFRGGCVQYGAGSCPVYRRQFYQGTTYIYVIGFRLVTSKF